ncbi:hypothetical protein EVAR_64675_1 [Eumeta japonica]|uniref:Uncharacterized protein n=1 Tax=Eumeta variegata TaxID=151549 RepID=A0A4C1ZV64_EUMVA|nr:hypothetical protein EVAR_64675_1 [Eumeta japonica]
MSSPRSGQRPASEYCRPCAGERRACLSASETVRVMITNGDQIKGDREREGVTEKETKREKAREGERELRKVKNSDERNSVQ